MWQFCATLKTIIELLKGMERMLDLMKMWKRHRLRKALKKQSAVLKNFRHVDEDILPAAACSRIGELLAQAETLAAAPDASAVQEWEDSAAALLKEYNPHSTIREILDVLAVALMVAFGIRALFFQPFKIPTSSMQPTLYGIHYIDHRAAEQVNGVSKLFGKLGSVGNYLAFSARRAELKLDKPLIMGNELFPRSSFLIFDSTILPLSGNQQAVLPGRPEKVADYAELYPGKRLFGNVVDGYLSDGDHLFVNRLSLHWREPQRGDVMVFATENIIGPGGEKPSDSGDYYIKRLVGMPHDTLKIVDNVLMVKTKDSECFVPIYELAPQTAKLYSKKGGYQGHSNLLPGVSHFLRSNDDEYTVPADHYFMLGDNTRFSADSRVWGSVPRRNLIGRPAIIFWPFSRRWGTVDRLEPLDVPTGQAGIRTFPSMNLQ